MMQTPGIRRLFNAFLLMGAGLMGAGWCSSSQAAEKLTEVIVQAATEQSVHSTIEALGTLRANESITLTPNLTKTITQIHFEDGQRVAKGQVLVEMTSAEESALLQEAGYTADEAKKQLQRVKSLAKSGAASASLLDQRVREYEAARARYNAVESRLKDLRLIAPFSGVLGLRNVSVGALVSPGDKITTLNDDSKMKLDFTVPSVYLQSLHIGLPISAKSRALGDKNFAGEIFSIDNQIDEVTRAITVRAILDNSHHELKQGMLMLVDLQSAKRQAILISEAALVPLGSENFVFVAKPDASDTHKASLERRHIVIGERFAGAVEVRSGLVVGEQVITHGLQKVRDGQQVAVLSLEAPVDLSKGDQEHLSELLKSATTEQHQADATSADTAH